MSRYCKKVYEISAAVSEDEFLQRVVAAIRHYGADVLLAVTSRATKFMIKHREALSAHVACAAVPTEESYRYSEDKGLLARKLESEGIPYPESWHPEDEGFEERLRMAEGPFLCKPVDGVFGLGIQMHESVEEVLQYLDSKRSTGQRHIVQRYLKGDDFDCSVYCEDGRILAHTMQTPIVKTSRFGSGSDLQMKQSAQVLDIMQRLMGAVRWSGVAHVDLLRNKDSGQYYVLEINGRFWGSVMASTAAGVNFPEIACRRALGEAVPKPEQRSMKFHTVGLGLRDFVLGTFAASGRKFQFRETLLPYFCMDPLPDLYVQASRLKAK